MDGLVVNAVTDQAVVDAFNKAEALADNRARKLVLTESAIIFRQNNLPWTISVSPSTDYADAIVINGLDFVFDTRTDASNNRTVLDLFRDSLSLWSGNVKGKVYTSVWSRKENWFNSDSPTKVAGDDAVFASATIYENLWQNKVGSAMVSGEIIKGKGIEVVCDRTNLCIPNGTTLTTKDMLAVWSQVNYDQNGIHIHFAKRGLTADQADEIVRLFRSSKGPSFFVNDEANQPIMQVNTNAKLDFVPDRTFTNSFRLEQAPRKDGSNTYTLHLWMKGSKATLPCVYQSYCYR
jgi:hypothetical protein